MGPIVEYIQSYRVLHGVDLAATAVPLLTSQSATGNTSSVAQATENTANPTNTPTTKQRKTRTSKKQQQKSLPELPNEIDNMQFALSAKYNADNVISIRNDNYAEEDYNSLLALWSRCGDQQFRLQTWMDKFNAYRASLLPTASTGSAPTTSATESNTTSSSAVTMTSVTADAVVNNSPTIPISNQILPASESLPTSSASSQIQFALDHVSSTSQRSTRGSATGIRMPCFFASGDFRNCLKVDNLSDMFICKGGCEQYCCSWCIKDAHRVMYNKVICPPCKVSVNLYRLL